MTLPEHELSISQRLADWGADLDPSKLNSKTISKCRDLLVDSIGLCLASRNTDYVTSVIKACEPGQHVIIGHDVTASATSAALVNGTAVHGEDFDDTFEGGPVHTSAVMIPAMLAAAETYRLSSRQIILGILVGTELFCRLALTLPKAIHQAGFHPTAVLGSFASAFGCTVATGSDRNTISNALGIAGSMAAGIIEYLGDGSWTKRMHPGWAAQSGLMACAMAKGGFIGPRRVFEGEHGVFKAFAGSITPRTEKLFEELGSRFYMETISFKPYPCGTMVQPYIDCANRLREKGVNISEIISIECETAEGIVHRLWEPLQSKHHPVTPYAAKFSVPFGIALGLVRGRAGLADFSDAAISEPALLDLAAKVKYKIDPDNPYPDAFTGHVRVVLKNGEQLEAGQGNLRGGQQAPLSRQEIDEKFNSNVTVGGHPDARSILDVCNSIGEMQGDYQLIRALGSS
jgi:2-methylcitrate dehydratase PrpD